MDSLQSGCAAGANSYPSPLVRNLLVTGAAGFIGSNLTLELQRRHPEARIIAVDDFRSGDFRNLRGFRGDFVTADVSRLDWVARFRGHAFDAIFHEASITDTTEHNQWLQCHDNIEGFRRLLEFAAPHRIPVVYATSAATYGVVSGIQVEDQPLAPANVYAFTKVQLENLARDFARRDSSWRIIGLRYFNVYGPGEAHKGSAASMIYQLYRQISAGKAPRVFRGGEHRRDFVYIKDVVALTIRALEAPGSDVFNCGSGRSFSFNDVIEQIQRTLNTHQPTDYFDNPYSFYQPHTEANMGKAKAVLGFQPDWAPEVGVPDYVRSLMAT